MKKYLALSLLIVLAFPTNTTLAQTDDISNDSVASVTSTQDENSNFRDLLLQGIADGSILNMSEEELSTLTDTQLNQTYQLAQRYGQDIMGTDLTGFATIAKALFIDQTIDWNQIEPQLTFNSTDYTSFQAMIPEVDLLHNYLTVVYAEQSAFNHLNAVPSTEQLTSILQHLQTMEETTFGDEVIYPGRIYWIIDAVNNARYASEEDDDDSIFNYSDAERLYANVWLTQFDNEGMTQLNVTSIPAGSPLYTYGQDTNQSTTTYPVDVIYLSGAHSYENNLTFSDNRDGTITLYDIPSKWPAMTDKQALNLTTEILANAHVESITDHSPQELLPLLESLVYKDYAPEESLDSEEISESINSSIESSVESSESSDNSQENKSDANSEKSTSSTVSVSSDKKAANRLPNTGESTNVWLFILAIILLAAAGLLLYRRRK